MYVSRHTMEGISRHQYSSSWLNYVFIITIGSIFFMPSDVYSWTPEKSPTKNQSLAPRNRYHTALKSFEGETQSRPWVEEQLSASIPRKNGKSVNKSSMVIEEFQSILQLIFACMGLSIILISWEDISMPHPMRVESQTLLSSPSTINSASVVSRQKSPFQWGRSTIRGLASGGMERQAIAAAGDLESTTYNNLPSYNEVMLTHRVDRIPSWHAKENNMVAATTRKDVDDSVRAIQLALLRIRDCVELANDYEWDQLTQVLNEKILRDDLQNACYVLKGADKFLSRDARDEIGFDWGSCAWRHCGALSDAQEAMDALEHQVGMLEPFECVYCLDVVERSLRDILAVSNKYADKSLQIPDYIPIQRMSDIAEQEDDALDRQDADYMNTLSILKNSEF